MEISNEITLVKFLKMYYNIPSGKVKYLRHKELRFLLPNIKCVYENDFETLSRKVATGQYLRIRDCEGVIMYYENPLYKQEEVVLEDFENNSEFKNAPLYHRFREYEEQADSENITYEEEIYGYEGPLSGVPRISLDEIEDMDKWELLELKDILTKYNKITMGAYYVLIAKVKEELKKRRKESIVEKRAYIKKKENEKYN